MACTRPLPFVWHERAGKHQLVMSIGIVSIAVNKVYRPCLSTRLTRVDGDYATACVNPLLQEDF